MNIENLILQVEIGENKVLYNKTPMLALQKLLKTWYKLDMESIMIKNTNKVMGTCVSQIINQLVSRWILDIFNCYYHLVSIYTKQLTRY